MKVLVSDNLAKEGIEVLKKEKDLTVDVKLNLKPEELISCIGEYDALLVRSETKVTKEVIEAAKNMKVIGRAGVGVDNIDVAAASRKGIIVMNAPDANTISTAEQTMSLIMSMSRNIPQAYASLKSKKWDRKKFVGVELNGKILGVIGLGRIGTEVVKRALSFGMKVLAFDPLVSHEKALKLQVELVSLDELISSSDYITVHTPLTADTKHMISDKEFANMKDGVRVVNCARGGIIDEAALYNALKSGKVAGASLDVFEKEPPFESPLLELDNVIVTPHLGASTEEAQINVSVVVAEQVIDTLRGKGVRNAVNIPAISPELLKEIRPYINLAERLGKLQSQIADGRISEVNVEYSGAINDNSITALTLSVLKGLLEPMIGNGVNYVNAQIIAKEKGIKIIESKNNLSYDFTSLITVRVFTDKGERIVAGTIFGKSEPRLVNIDGYDMDAVPSDYMLIFFNLDKPGVVGNIGTMLGKENINIAGLHMGRKETGGKAVTVLNIDGEVSKEVLAKLSKLENIIAVKSVKL